MLEPLAKNAELSIASMMRHLVMLRLMTTTMTHLDYFDCHEQGEGESGHDEQDGDHGHEVCADARALVAN